MTEKQIIEKLRDDVHYFGDFGKMWFSNSEISKLIEKPDTFADPWEPSLDFEKGRYIHYKMLQPELFEGGNEPMIIVDASTRNNKEYKEVVGEHQKEDEPRPLFLLRKEVGELDYLVSLMMRNDEFVEVLQKNRKPNEVEEPAIGEIMGYKFKGKADRKNSHLGILADLKSTRSLESFRMNFKNYGYHSQAYIYQELFGMPVRFYVISKEDGRLGIFDVSDETLELGRQRVALGLEKYETYWGENPTQNVDQYVDYDVL